MTDQHVGQLVFLRVYSGTLEAGSGVYNSTKDKKERIGRLLRMHANKKEEVEAVAAGDIAAAIGLKLHDHRRHAVRRRQADRAGVDDVPGAGHRGRDRAEDARRRGEARRRAGAAGRWKTRRSGSPPTRRRRRPSSTGWASCTWRSSSTACCASSSVEANVGKPQVAFRETIRRKGEAQGKYVRQTGGRGQYGDVYIEVEPNEAGERLRVREQDRGRLRSRASTCRRSRRASRRRCRPACWPATRWWTSRSS